MSRLRRVRFGRWACAVGACLMAIDGRAAVRRLLRRRRWSWSPAIAHKLRIGFLRAQSPMRQHSARRNIRPRFDPRIVRTAFQQPFGPPVRRLLPGRAAPEELSRPDEDPDESWMGGRSREKAELGNGLLTFSDDGPGKPLSGERGTCRIAPPNLPQPLPPRLARPRWASIILTQPDDLLRSLLRTT